MTIVSIPVEWLRFSRSLAKIVSVVSIGTTSPAGCRESWSGGSRPMKLMTITIAVMGVGFGLSRNCGS
jgi:hypothetical protein